MLRRFGRHLAVRLGTILVLSSVRPQPGNAQSLAPSQTSSPSTAPVNRSRVDDEIRTEYTLGQILFKTGDFKGSEEAFRKIVSLLKVADPKSKALGEAFFALGGIQVKLGAFGAAAESYESSLALRREIDPDGPSVVESLVGLARISVSSGDYAKAEQLNLEQLAILSKRVPDSVVELSCLDDLADLAGKLGAPVRAQAYGEMAASKWQRRVARDKRVVETLVLRTGAQQGEFANKIGTLRGALEAAESAGEEGDRHFGKKEFKAAAVWYQRSLLLFEAVYPDGHETSELNYRLGVVYYKLGDLGRAEAFTRTALEIQEGIDSDSLEAAEKLNNLATVLHDIGKHRDAETYHMKAASIRQKLAPKSEDLAASFEKLADICAEDQRFSQDAKYYRLALEIRQDLGHSEKTLGIREKLAGLEQKQGRQ